MYIQIARDLIEASFKHICSLISLYVGAKPNSFSAASMQLATMVASCVCSQHNASNLKHS